MTHETKKAIEKIITICEKSRQPTARVLRIYDIALESLGLTENQRAELINKLKQEKVQAYRDKLMARQQKEKENE